MISAIKFNCLLVVAGNLLSSFMTFKIDMMVNPKMAKTIKKDNPYVLFTYKIIFC